MMGSVTPIPIGTTVRLAPWAAPSLARMYRTSEGAFSGRGRVVGRTWIDDETPVPLIQWSGNGRRTYASHRMLVVVRAASDNPF